MKQSCTNSRSWFSSEKEEKWSSCFQKRHVCRLQNFKRWIELSAPIWIGWCLVSLNTQTISHEVQILVDQEEIFNSLNSFNFKSPCQWKKIYISGYMHLCDAVQKSYCCCLVEHFSNKMIYDRHQKKGFCVRIIANGKYHGIITSVE